MKIASLILIALLVSCNNSGLSDQDASELEALREQLAVISETGQRMVVTDGVTDGEELVNETDSQEVHGGSSSDEVTSETVLELAPDGITPDLVGLLPDKALRLGRDLGGSLGSREYVGHRLVDHLDKR